MVQVTRKEYQQIHVWLRDTFGNAIACENPKCEKESTTFQYALRAGKTHKKLRANYMTLCGQCHRRYDIEHKNTGHQTIKAPDRLSMKLLWKYAAEYSHRPDKAYNHQNVIDFLNSFESRNDVQKVGVVGTSNLRG